MTKVTLPWADKFRELFHADGISNVQVVNQFMTYVDEEELKINKEFEKHK